MAGLSLGGKKGLFIALLALALIALIFYGGMLVGQRKPAQGEDLTAGRAAAASASLGQAGEAVRSLLEAEEEPVFAIQVGNFMVKSDCELVLEDLQQRGYPAYVVQIRDGERLLHRIHVGPYPTFGAAENAAEQFVLEEEIDAIPIRARSGPLSPAQGAEEEAPIAEG